MFLLAYGLANGRPKRKQKYDPVPTQYLANRALIGLWTQTVQLHSTTLTLTLDTLKLTDAVAATVPWKTHQSWIFMLYYCLSYERV